MQIPNFSGLNGFVWWLGTVENRMDPLQIGRLQIRLHAWHSENKTLIPTGDLPWAFVSWAINNNDSFETLKEGDWCWGFFLDNEDAQVPMAIGYIPGRPTTILPATIGFSDPRTTQQLANSPAPPASKIYQTDGTGITIKDGPASRNPSDLGNPTYSPLARGVINGTFIEERNNNLVQNVETSISTTWSEPKSAYAPVYPYNHVKQTESGHIFELDDTPGVERIQLAHRSGTFLEDYPDGSRVEKITKNKYSIVMGDEFVYIMGDINVTIQGNSNIFVMNNANVKIGGNALLTVAGNFQQDISGDYSLKIGGETLIEYGSDIQTNYVGDVHSYIHGDTYSRHDAGIDYSCPADPTRTSGDNCDPVKEPK